MNHKPHPAHAPCPCESGLPYAECCGLWHTGMAAGRYAPTPEALMRSRYSGYVLGQLDYLLFTWHVSSAPGDLELPPVKWLGLEVRSAAEAGDAGIVEFVARCRDGGKAQRMHETSRFVRQDGRWYYIDGQMHGAELGQ
jgi:SEC-C motif-containing protein